MSRQNESYASNSNAASVAFRQTELKRSGIFFPPDAQRCSTDLEQLKTSITYLPNSLCLARTSAEAQQAIDQLSDEMQGVYTDALRRAELIDEIIVQSCFLQHERVWMREVNEVMLSVFFTARRQGHVSSTEDYVWAEGRDLTNLHSPVTLGDPKPDAAFGLKASASSRSVAGQDKVKLSLEVLEALHESPSIKLTYSPSRRKDIIYPAIVYEAKSDSNPILWAENQAAVGVSRALGLLGELSRLSGSGDIPPVFAITSAGSQWQIHIAFMDSDGKVHLSPLLLKKLSVEDFAERLHLQVILHRLFQWLLGPYTRAVELCLAHLRAEIFTIAAAA